MIKCLFCILAMLVTTATYCQRSDVNMLQQIQMNVAREKIEIKTGDGFSKEKFVPYLEVPFTVPADKFKNKHVRDSLYSLRYDYIKEAVAKGYSQIRIFILKEGRRIGGVTSMTYEVNDLIKTKYPSIYE